MGRAFEYRRAAKEARWDKMSKVFPKLAKAITVAAKDGGCDPKIVLTLRLSFMTAKQLTACKSSLSVLLTTQQEQLQM